MAEKTQLYEYRKGKGDLVVESTVDDFVTRIERDALEKSDGNFQEYGFGKELVYDSEFLKGLIKRRHNDWKEKKYE